mmetsp:Transcript_7480/g.27100  ORF Transcript_7480/g.27100 Transcript_7480/m.27100 type:complete len:219 (+) Transcript_7480:729-1385(+)
MSGGGITSRATRDGFVFVFAEKKESRVPSARSLNLSPSHHIPPGSLDGELERSDAVDPTFDLIPRDEGAHAIGRSHHDEVSRAELHVAGQEGDGLRDAPRVPAQVPALDRLAVHLEPDLTLQGVRYLGTGHQLAHRGAAVEALGHVPRPPVLLILGLQVPPREVHPDPVAPNVREGVGLGDVPATLPDGNDLLDLVVQVLGLWRVGHHRDVARGVRWL